MRNTLLTLLALFVAGLSLAQDEKKIYTREEIKTLVYNKAKDEVKKLLGTANRTGYRKWGNENIAVWEYDGIVKDKDAKEVDEVTLLWFGNYSGDDKLPRVNRFTAGKKPR